MGAWSATRGGACWSTRTGWPSTPRDRSPRWPPRTWPAASRWRPSSCWPATRGRPCSTYAAPAATPPVRCRGLGWRTSAGRPTCSKPSGLPCRCSTARPARPTGDRSGSPRAGATSVVGWLDHRLAELGRRRTGDEVPVKVWSLSAVLRVPTDGGPLYLKAACDWFRSEPVHHRGARAAVARAGAGAAGRRAGPWVAADGSAGRRVRRGRARTRTRRPHGGDDRGHAGRVGRPPGRGCARPGSPSAGSTRPGTPCGPSPSTAPSCGSSTPTSGPRSARPCPGPSAGSRSWRPSSSRRPWSTATSTSATSRTTTDG